MATEKRPATKKYMAERTPFGFFQIDHSKHKGDAFVMDPELVENGKKEFKYLEEQLAKFRKTNVDEGVFENWVNMDTEAIQKAIKDGLQLGLTQAAKALHSNTPAVAAASSTVLRVGGPDKGGKKKKAAAPKKKQS